MFNEQKVYLNNRLTIVEIAQLVGTNRTYVSTMINQNFNENFCTFVNNYRLEELNLVIKKHPEFTNQLLAESCGFGSVDSLKRAVKSKTNKTLQTWKTETLSVL
ncbi:MAG: helix-turn-helix transcriptional regulator [Paludibacter sp.]|nr:helix-turn-helix transcriptional regulator [Paludibacter sp.]